MTNQQFIDLVCDTVNDYKDIESCGEKYLINRIINIVLAYINHKEF